MNKQAVGPMLFVLMVAAAVPAAGSTTYYVNGACGNDAWSGLSPDCAPTGGPKATIQAGIDAASDGDVVVVAPSVYYEKIDFLGKALALQSSDGPEATVIDAERTGRVVTCGSGEASGTLLEGFTIANGYLPSDSGTAAGIYIAAGHPTVRNCIVRDNEAANSAAMRVALGSSPLIDGCTFTDNKAIDGCVTTAYSHPIFKDCLFYDNDGGFGPGALTIAFNDGIPVMAVNCRIIGNISGALSGGAVDGGDTVWVNCVFADNDSGGLTPGALSTVGSPTVINCTFSDNTGTALFNNDYPDDLAVFNSILWDNSGGAVSGGGAVIRYSDVQGGWSGSGNINADPLFVQAGVGDVRLSFGSPCVNAGDNGALPPDDLDLDGDGNTSEPIPIDLDANDRIQGGVVDMGAYEGEFEPLPPAQHASGLDQGESVILIPDGGDLDPLASAAVLVRNVSGPDNATFVVTQMDWDPHPGAGGYSELSSVLDFETSLADGEFWATFFVPFDADDLDGGYPLEPDLTCFDPAVGNWSLAVAANTAPSPGYGTQYGDRITSGPGQGWGTTGHLGDYGVYWEPIIQQGFVWAKVDHAGAFGVGVVYCPADCRQTPDGVVGVGDFLAMLATWGGRAGGGPCDLDANGLVDVADFPLLLGAWGPCPQNAVPPREGWTHVRRERGARAATASLRTADLDGNGVVGRSDLLILHDAWGPCAGCPADIDGDGAVGVADLLALTAAWN
ncbi:MAG: right-handed parallel beta-helix repeat-containing protein [Planctomycetota bacterium]|jgi:hypothetical protein